MMLQKLASSLFRGSARSDPRAAAWLHGLNTRQFSSGSSGSDSSDGESSSDSDEDDIAAKLAQATIAPPADATVFEVFDDDDAPPPPPPAASSSSGGPHLWRQVDGGFPVSPAFFSLWKEARGMDEEEIMQRAAGEASAGAGRRQKAADAAIDGSRPPRPAPVEPATTEDCMLLAETIEAYLNVFPQAEPDAEGIGHVDRAILAAMALHFRAKHGDGGRSTVLPREMDMGTPLETRVVNTAPPGRLAWEILGVEEERGTLHWAVDLTDGKAADPWRNARLSDSMKMAMYRAHKADPVKYNVAELARTFKIRQQRVMAILALKELEEASPEAQSPEAEELASVMEDEWDCYEATGTGERHYVTIPSYPAYAQADENAVLDTLVKATGKSRGKLVAEGISPELAKAAMGVKPHAQVEEEVAATEEAHLVAEFRTALDFNLGKTGKGLMRTSRRKSAPKRPEEGWSLLVTPLGKEADKPYVAKPDGSKRPLNEDEALLVDRRTPRPRRRIL